LKLHVWHTKVGRASFGLLGFDVGSVEPPGRDDLGVLREAGVERCPAKSFEASSKAVSCSFGNVTESDDDTAG